MQTSLTALSCAKVNLTLDITGLLPNGYHELRSVVHTLALHDELRFELDDSGEWRFSCDDAALQTHDNLCLKAARAWAALARERGLVRDAGGHISLTKRTPYGAGLGGGSGNAWAVLAALSHAFDPGATIPNTELLDLAKTLGADVPLFAKGGAALIEGIGERVTPLPPLDAWVVLAQPREITSTPAAYRAWDALAKDSSHATSALLEAWDEARDSKSGLQVLAERLGNDLRHAAKALGVPVEEGILALYESGAVGAEMTGSGSAVFGLCEGEEHASSVEGSARQILEERAPGEWRLWKAPLCSYGVRLGQAEALA